MKISRDWLSDFLPQPPDPEMIGDALMRGGFPIESIEMNVGDAVLDVEVTSNRGDCLSHVGVAREVSALTDRIFRHENAAMPTEAGTPVKEVTSVAIEAAQLCPHYVARVIRGVRVGPSPAWMVKRLEAVGLRSINNVVDVTNYVMFELGQPLHAFDFDKLSGQRIVVREARRGEKIVSIDGKQRELSPGMLVIADAEKPAAVAGVMGGLNSEVTTGTVNILLESARFDPLSVRRTARALAMKSDSSYRFERGIDPMLPERASLRAAQLILEAAGGELLSGAAVAGESGDKPKTLALRLARLDRLLGIDVPPREVVAALDRLQLSPKLAGDAVTVSVPSWRLDLNIEADLIEEVARVIGYDKVPVRETVSIRLAPPEPWQRSMELIRETLVAAGYFEAVTFSFVSDALAGNFVSPEAQSLPRADPAVRKADARLRPSLLPGLLQAVRHNETNGAIEAKLFEAGATFWNTAGGVDERRRLGLVGSSDLREVRGAVEAILQRLDKTRELKVIPDQRRGYGTCGRIEWGGQTVGHLGRIDRAVVEKLGLNHTPTAAELELEPLLAGAQHVPQLKPLPRFPAIRRDLTLDLAESTRYEQVESLIRSLSPEHLEAVEYVTTYRGKPVEKGKKSVTATLVFRSPTITLTSEQIEPAVQRVIDAAKQQLRATLRS
ncbi:MAG TPA: phenylalanine--tRNA ligase subunit beta [Tepidisphaeraceae bacterium]|nr:phenylalanine--tRNA ligase subunit beta [Tepidisphaeraceae bacterium]